MTYAAISDAHTLHLLVTSMTKQVHLRAAHGVDHVILSCPSWTAGIHAHLQSSNGDVNAKEGLPSFLGPEINHMLRGKDLVGLISHCDLI